MLNDKDVKLFGKISGHGYREKIASAFLADRHSGLVSLNGERL